MADDDLGIVYKDDNTSSKKTANKISDDDLGITYKDDSEDVPDSPSILTKTLDVLAPGLGSMSHILGMNLKTIPRAGLDILKSIPAAVSQSAANASSLAPFSPASNFLQQAAQTVPTPSPQTSSMLSMAANVIPGVKGLEGIGQLGNAALKTIAPKLADLTGFNANTKATEFIKGLIGDQAQIKKAFRTNYNDIKSAAEQKGYGVKSEDMQGYSSLVPNNIPKPIEADNFNGELNGLSVDDKTTLLNNLNAKKKEILDKFSSVPSYENAHALQSMLGRVGVKFLKNPETAQTGGEILNLRSSLNKDIQNTFNKYGDTDLSSARQEVTNQYAQNENRLLLADKLKSGIQNLPGEGLSANAQKIINAYSKAGFKKILGRYESPMKTPASDASVKDIMDALNRQSNTKWLAATLGVPLTIGALGGSAYEGLRKIF